MSLVFFEQNPQHCIVSAHSLCVQHWSVPPSFEALALVHEQCEQGVRQYGRISQLAVLGWKTGLMGRAERQRATELHAHFQTQSLGSCVVFDTLGLSGLMLRTLAAGVQLMGLGHTPVKVLPRVAVALRWLGALPGQHPETVREFFALEEQLRWPVALHGGGNKDHSGA